MRSSDQPLRRYRKATKTVGFLPGLPLLSRRCPGNHTAGGKVTEAVNVVLACQHRNQNLKGRLKPVWGNIAS